MIGAALVTVAMLALMTSLIAEEFTPQDVVELGSFDINVAVEDIFVIEDRIPPEPLQAVDTPPPPPAVEIPATDLPLEPIVSTSQPELVMNLQIDMPTGRDLVISDTDPTPLVRIPPVMPPRADRSGHCQVGFDISPDGKPFNVRANSCSQSLFERAAVRAVTKWTYRPEIRDGIAVTRTGLQTRITFQLTDERGQLIPE
jgi:protein TonB